ncbi:MAG: energy transducer TonB [Betaproteobacteria bacterium]|nr:energy transducer TonB [Betaproteobacteria bacterium]
MTAPAEAPSPLVAPAPSAPAAPTEPAPVPAVRLQAAPAPAVAITAPVFSADYLDNPSPAYPAISRRLGEQGRVVLRVLVSAAGLIQEVQVRTSSGHARLDEAARETVHRWRFVPARRGEQPVAAWVLISRGTALGPRRKTNNGWGSWIGSASKSRPAECLFATCATLPGARTGPTSAVLGLPR